MKSKEVITKLDDILSDIDSKISDHEKMLQHYSNMRKEVDDLIKQVSKGKKKLSKDGVNKVVDELIVNDTKYYIDNESIVYSEEGNVIGKKKKNKIILG